MAVIVYLAIPLPRGHTAVLHLAAIVTQAITIMQLSFAHVAFILVKPVLISNPVLLVTSLTNVPSTH